jgi:hypothetical protein
VHNFIRNLKRQMIVLIFNQKFLAPVSLHNKLSEGLSIYIFFRKMYVRYVTVEPYLKTICHFYDTLDVNQRKLIFFKFVSVE